ncbi:MAG: dihydrofolate reductase [Bacteroidales bacterium]|nr:dihydrofolate reductase [Bacteroidales bacterium]
MKLKLQIMVLLFCLSLPACQRRTAVKGELAEDESFEFVVDRFADIEIMRYKVDDWEDLSLRQKELVYYLSEAALCGRDIIFAQNCKYNLTVKTTLENIVSTYNGERDCPEWLDFMVYVKRFWFSNGFHHHYSNDKFFPDVDKSYFKQLILNSAESDFPLADGEDISRFADRMTDIVYNKTIAPVKVCQNTQKDLVLNSAVNFYENVTQKEADKFYAQLRKNDTSANPAEPLSYGLNSRLVKNGKGEIVEQPYKIGGLYSAAIEKIVFWLQKAAEVAENDAQKAHIEKLIDYYRTGDLKTWDEYNVLWVQDTESHIDYVNGFIEVYDDPLGQKATWEAVVNYKDLVNNRRTEVISKNAQWFEDNSPIDRIFKKKEVKGIEAKVITVAQLGGANYPATPIGINLPNANWIRKQYGSKSVTMENIMYAYAQAKLKNGTIQEFYYSDDEIEAAKKYGYVTDNLQVDLHECLGHGSGQMLPGVNDDMLKNYHSVIEETRADLFSLYYIADKKIVELTLLPDTSAYKTCYYKYIVNAMMLQLNRLEKGAQITEAHMRNRAIIANWCYEKGLKDNVIEKVEKEGKTYIKINDYAKLRSLFAQLLIEVQKIKSTGDYAAAKALVEQYGVKVDEKLHAEVTQRFSSLSVAPYGGFINPEFVVEKSGDKITDIKVTYPTDYTQQMLDYSAKYGFLK